MKSLKIGTAGVTAITLILSAPALAQEQGSTTNEATDGDAQVGGQPIERAITEADAPDIAETDPVNETAANEIGGSAVGDGQMMILDVESFAQDIYERGFRQGYVRGISDARVRFSQEMQQQEQRRQQQQAEAQQRADEERQRQAQGNAQDDRPRMMGTGDGGMILILPDGMTADAFMDRLMRENMGGQGSEGGSNGSGGSN